MSSWSMVRTYLYDNSVLFVAHFMIEIFHDHFDVAHGHGLTHRKG